MAHSLKSRLEDLYLAVLHPSITTECANLGPSVTLRPSTIIYEFKPIVARQLNFDFCYRPHLEVGDPISLHSLHQRSS